MFDSIIETIGQLVTIVNILFCLAIYGIVFVQRKIVEFMAQKWFPSFINSKLWQELLVPIAPLGTGVLLSLLITNYPYPEMFSSRGSHFVYGLGCGLISGLVYRLVKKTLSGSIKSALEKAKESLGSSKEETEENNS